MQLLLRAFIAVFLVSLPVAAANAEGLKIDVPVALKDAKVAFNMDHSAFDGDEPTGFGFMRIMAERFREDGTDGHIVAIFHGEAGYMMLNDAAYNRARNWRAGNPYKEQIKSLIDEGVEFEECGHTMQVKGWGNDDLLPGVKVNTGANFRLIELVQKGYVQLQP